MYCEGAIIFSKKSFLDWIFLPFNSIFRISSNTTEITLSSPNSGNTLEIYCSNIVLGEILDKFIYDIPCQWIEFDDVYYEGTCVVNRQTLQDKILGRTETPLGIKLEQLEDYILELIFGTGKGRGHKAEKNLVKQEIQKFIKIDIFELYKTLFCNKLKK